MFPIILAAALISAAPDNPDLISIEDMAKADPTVTCKYEKVKEQCGICNQLICRNAKDEEFASPDKKCDFKECVSKVKRN